MQQSWAAPWVSETQDDKPLGSDRPSQGWSCGKFAELFDRLLRDCVFLLKLAF